MIQTLFGGSRSDEKEEKKSGFFERMKQAVTRTRESLTERIEEAVSFNKEIDRNTLDELEATLISADLGTTTTQEVLAKLRDKADRKQIQDVDELKRLLKAELLTILKRANVPPVQAPEGMPEVILVVGVNGTGKTTSIGKLAQFLRSEGKNVLLQTLSETDLKPIYEALTNAKYAHLDRLKSFLRREGVDKTKD